MRIEYDKDIDSIYIRIQEKRVSKTKVIEDGLHLDFDKKGRLIGIEILDAPERYPKSDIFNISTENLIIE